MPFTRIPLVRNPHYKTHGTKSYVHLLRKYKFRPTKGGPYYESHHSNKLIKANADGTRGDVPADDVQNDTEYLAEVTIGTPGIKLALDFDTGSSDLWVWSTELPQQTQAVKSASAIFNPKNSSTFKTMTNSTWKIQYGDNSTASGTVGTDNINLGGLVIKAQAIELASTLSAQFQQDTSSGLLGLAWPILNTVKPKAVKTPVQNMIDQQDISANEELFTVYLGSYKNQSDPSFYTFGYIDQDVVTASGQSIAYTQIDNSQGFWQVPSATATVNGKTIQIPQSGGNANTTILDTGTTLALVSDTVCAAVYKAIPGAKYDDSNQGYIYPTSTTIDQLPVVTVAVGNQQYTIGKEALGFSDAGNNMTYGAIQSRGSLTFDILGDVFLKNVYVIFDAGNARVGLVQRKSPTSAK